MPSILGTFLPIKCSTLGAGASVVITIPLFFTRSLADGVIISVPST